jgi:hypothetical protein
MSVPNRMTLSIAFGEAEAGPISGVMHAVSSGVHLMWRAPAALRLLGRADGGIVPASVQVVLVAAATNTLAPPADEEEAAGA